MNKKTHNTYPSGIPNWLLYIPIFVSIVLIPGFVKFCLYETHLNHFTWFSGSDQSFDMFNYSKQIIAIILDVVVIGLLIYLGIKKELSLPKTFIPIIIMGAMTLLSTIFSIYPYVSLMGFYENMESIFVLFGYWLMFFYTYTIVRTRNCPQIIIYAVAATVGYIGFVAFTQFCGFDFIFSGIGKILFIPGYYSSYRDILTANGTAGHVYATLMNPNYVGVFSCILAPLLMVLSFSISKKKQILPYLGLAILIMFCLVGCGSKTAVLAILPCMLFMVICFGKKHWKKMIPVFSVYILLFAILNIFVSVFQNAVDYATAEIEDFKEYDLKSIDLQDDVIEITYKDTTLYVKYETTSDQVIPQLTDASGQQIGLLYDDAIVSPDDSRYEGLHFFHYIDESAREGYFIYSDDDITSFFIIYSEEDETYYYINRDNREAKIHPSESVDFPLLHLMNGFNGRGYIWSKSIPLLKQTLLIGSGPDTYPILFPQDDYVSQAHGGYEKQLITKPHNMYIQMGIHIGVVALIAYLVLYIIYFFQSLSIYFGRELSSTTERLGAAIYIASMCFCIAGFIHDSAVSTSFIYWTLLGCGFACNYLIKNQNKQETNAS